MDHAGSPNALFGATVRRAERIAPGFVRLALHGDELRHLVPRGLDQRMKLLIPRGPYSAELLEPLLPEREWRRRWRALDESVRPALRSYTVGEVRPERGELDIDVFVHAEPGPASAWSLAARPGDPLLLSAPYARRERGLHGVQWRPGAAERMLLAGDETALPAIAGILRSLDASARVDVILEVGDRGDLVLLAPLLDGARSPSDGGVRGPGGAQSSSGDGASGLHDVRLDVRMRAPGVPGGAPLTEGVAAWAAAHGAEAAALGERFFAWCATETGRVARIRSLLAGAGIRSDRVNAQGYWNDRPRSD